MTDIKEAQELEVVAWQDAENQLYTTGEKRQMHAWATDGYPIVELVRLSDATAVIDQLKADNEAYKKLHDWIKAENERLKAVPMKYKRMEHNAKLQAENDTLRKHLDEARAIIDQQAGAEWQQSQQSAPAGYVMVPVKPTPEMLDCIMDWQKIGNVTAYRAMLAAAPKAEQPPVQEPVATVTIQHFRQDPRMENVDFQIQVTLPQGTHKLYAAPQPVSDDAKDALVEGLETIALESTDEQASCCAHHYLAAYRAAQEKK